MDKALVNQSIKTFLTELKMRIELLKGNEVTANVDNSNYESILELLYINGMPNIEDITVSKIENINKGTLKKLLKLTNANKDKLNDIIKNKNYEELINIIKKYLNDYESINKSQNVLFANKIELYQKYISLFEEENLTEPFNDLSELSKIMSDIALPDEDKWRILEYIAIMNNKVIEDYPEIDTKISYEYNLIEKYLEDKETKDYFTNYFTDKTVDIDTIPTITDEISKDISLDKDIINNIIVISIVKKLLDELKLAGSKNDQEEIIPIIYELFDKLVKIHNSYVYEGRKIKDNTEEFYYNSLNDGITDKDIKSFLETPLTLLEDNVGSKEKAIELKELSVLKPLYETLKHVDTVTIDTDDYKEIVNILKTLIEQFELLENKKLEKEIKL